MGEEISDFVSKNIFTNYTSGLEGVQKSQWNSPFPLYLPFFLSIISHLDHCISLAASPHPPRYS